MWTQNVFVVDFNLPLRISFKSPAINNSLEVHKQMLLKFTEVVRCFKLSIYHFPRHLDLYKMQQSTAAVT